MTIPAPLSFTPWAKVQRRSHLAPPAQLVTTSLRDMAIKRNACLAVALCLTAAPLLVAGQTTVTVGSCEDWPSSITSDTVLELTTAEVCGMELIDCISFSRPLPVPFVREADSRYLRRTISREQQPHSAARVIAAAINSWLRSCLLSLTVLFPNK